MPEPASLRLPQLQRILGAMGGAAAAALLVRQLPVVPATLLSTLMLVGGAGVHGRLQSVAAWWTLVGAASGCLIATATVLAAAAQQLSLEQYRLERALVVLLLGLAGACAGRLLSRSVLWRPDRHPRDLLRSASALTTGVFAAIVTLTYIHAGLDAARAFSSRLSTALTILVVSLAAPAWCVHLLSRHPGDGHDA